jgi:hypothetical protein
MNHDLLRTALHEIGDMPPPADLAGTALTRAWRDRRRRTAGLVAAAAAVAAVAIAVPVTVLHRSPAPTAGPSTVRYLVSGYRAFGEPKPTGGVSVAPGLDAAFWDPARSAYASVPESLFVYPSPDGTWAAVVKDTDIDHVGVARLADLGGIGERAVSWLPDAGRYVGWSPDGGRLLTQIGERNSARLALVDVPSRAVRPVTLRGAGAFFRWNVTLGWQPDGAGFLAVQASSWVQPGAEPTGPSALWSFGPDGAATGSRPMPRADGFTLSPDGRRVLVLDQHRHAGAGGGVVVERARNVVYDFGSGRSTPVPELTQSWYGDDEVLDVSYDHGDTVARIVAVAGGRVVATRTVEHDPAVRYSSLLLTPLSGPAPPSAIVV